MARLDAHFFRMLGSDPAGQSVSGLGGAIVRRIAGVHRARMQVGRSAALGGLEVSVEFPAPSLSNAMWRRRKPVTLDR